VGDWFKASHKSGISWKGPVFRLIATFGAFSSNGLNNMKALLP